MFDSRGLTRAALAFGACLLVGCPETKPEAPVASPSRATAVTTASAAPKPVDCTTRPSCRDEGLCTRRGSACIAATDADCERSHACTSYQMCSAHAGSCWNVAPDPQKAPNKTCRSKQVWSQTVMTPCSYAGHCQEKDGRCVAGGDEDCKGSHLCKRSGRCTKSGGTCVATQDAQCKSSQLCCWDGACALAEGRCVRGTEEHCKSHAGCLRLGRCQLSGGSCVVGRDSDCAASHLCRAAGACKNKSNACVVGTDAGCKASILCEQEGRCAARDGSCVAGSDADCEQSIQCKVEGRCKAHAGRCWMPGDSDKDCRGFFGRKGRTPCLDDGECVAVEGACVAASEVRCKNSTACRGLDRCSLGGNKCVQTFRKRRLERWWECFIEGSERCAWSEDIRCEGWTGLGKPEERIARFDQCVRPSACQAFLKKQLEWEPPFNRDEHFH